MKLVELIDQIYVLRASLPNSELGPMYVAAIARAKLLEELAENVQEQRDVVTGIFPTDDQWDRSLVLGNRQREILTALKEEA